MFSCKNKVFKNLNTLNPDLTAARTGTVEVFGYFDLLSTRCEVFELWPAVPEDRPPSRTESFLHRSSTAAGLRTSDINDLEKEHQVSIYPTATRRCSLVK